MAASASPPETPSAPRVPHPAQVCPGTLSLLCHRSPAQPGAGLTRHLGRGFLLGEGAGTTPGCKKTSGGSFRLSAHPDLHRPTPAAPVPLRPGSAVPARCPHGAGGLWDPPIRLQDDPWGGITPLPTISSPFLGSSSPRGLCLVFSHPSSSAQIPAQDLMPRGFPAPPDPPRVRRGLGQLWGPARSRRCGHDTSPARSELCPHVGGRVLQNPNPPEPSSTGEGGQHRGMSQRGDVTQPSGHPFTPHLTEVTSRGDIAGCSVPPGGAGAASSGLEKKN